MGYLAVEEIESRVYKTKPPRDDEELMLPVPSRRTPLEVMVSIVRAPARHDKETLYPPHYFVVLDAATGRILRAAYGAPGEIEGKPAARRPFDSLGEKKKSDRDPHECYRALVRISPDVWQLYASGADTFDEPSSRLLDEYSGCTAATAPVPLLPYYRVMAPEFFDWLAKHAPREGLP